MPVDVNKDINEALMNDILMIYSDAEDKLLTAVAKRVAKGITEEGWNEKKLKNTQALQKDIEKILGSTSKLSKSKISKGIIDAYKQGFAGVGGQKGTHGTILDEIDIPMNLKMQVLATNKLLDNATFQVLRKANDAYQEVMAHSTTGLLAGVDTRIQASQKMLNEFASKGITSFVDKAGRNWDLSSYAEMCARTVGSHAALQGHIDRQVEVGEDLVKVSTIGTTCPICQRWQGVVLSISGNNPKYHSIDEAKASGLFHPNCKHTLGMFIPELDGEGKVEPDEYDETTYSSQRNKLIEQQRANERNIRYWKKRKALAITPEEQLKCQQKIKSWQYKNLIYCEKNGLRRQYAREGVMSGNASGPMGSFIGGSLKEYEEVYKAVVGESPKEVHKTLLKMNLQMFSEKKMYEKWLKDEIASLDELDVDKAMMKDANNKAVTPTSLYKKYIGDNPMKDWSEVSPYEKGTKEYKSGYAKWLKQQIDEIGVTYKVKPKYVEVHEDIPYEDTKLSATEIYKKYHDGEKPTEAYKKLGGEEGTGIKYGKWVENQKKELIKNGITKTVPFSNTATQKSVDTISQASQTIEKAKDTIKKAELENYKNMLDSSVHGQYDAYLKVKEQFEEYKTNSADPIVHEKMMMAKEKHLEMVKKKAEKEFGWGTGAFEQSIKNLEDMKAKETNLFMKNHIQAQIDEYEKVKKANDPLAKYDKIEQWFIDDYLDKMKKNDESSITSMKNDKAYFENLLKQHDTSWPQYEEVVQQKEIVEEALQGTLGMKQKEKEAFLKKKKEDEEAAKKKLEQEIKAGKVSIGREVSFKEGKLVKQSQIYNEVDFTDLDKLAKSANGNNLMKASRRDVLGRDIRGRNHHMGHDVSLVAGADKELGEAMQILYNDYINTIKCNDINLACVNGYDKASSLMKKKIDAIDKAISSCELNEPIVLNRFLSDEVANKLFGKLDLSEVKKGKIIENPSYMSTTVSGHSTFEKRDFMMSIQCDKGTHAFPTLNYEEGEVLLGRDGKLEVIDIIDHSNNPKTLKHFDGTTYQYKGKEIVVRYIEKGKSEDYEIPTPEKIDEMLGVKNVSHHTKESKEWIDSLSKDERRASDRYTGSYYVDMNNVYRRDDRSDKQIVKLSEDLTKALRRAETTKPVVLRRGIRRDDLAHMLGFNGDYSKVEENWDAINSGDYAAEDKGFLSTSPYSEGGFHKPVELRIYCPAGTHAAYVDSISTNRGEKETLLESGSMYRVLNLDNSGSRVIAYLELLGTD